jgi:hypothetical protein
MVPVCRSAVTVRREPHRAPITDRDRPLDGLERSTRNQLRDRALSPMTGAGGMGSLRRHRLIFFSGCQRSRNTG